MLLKITFATSEQQITLTKNLMSLNEKEISVGTVLSENGNYISHFSIEPSLFRDINNIVKGEQQEVYKDVTIEIVESVGQDQTAQVVPVQVETTEEVIPTKDEESKENLPRKELGTKKATDSDSVEETKEPQKQSE